MPHVRLSLGGVPERVASTRDLCGTFNTSYLTVELPHSKYAPMIEDWGGAGEASGRS